MRTLVFAVVVSLSVTPLAACSLDSDSKAGVPASGTGTTRTYAAADFTAVELRGADDVDVRVGTGFSVRAEGPSEALDKLKIERKGDTLQIGRINSRGINWGSKNKITVYVTMPRITEGNLAGSGDLTIDRVEGQEFGGNVAGSGNLTIAALSVQRAAFAIAGTGDTKVTGVAKQVKVDIAGTGDLDAGGLKAEGADVSIAGTGSVRAEVNGPAKVNILGTGDVDLGKGATCSISKMGTGEVRCGS